MKEVIEMANIKDTDLKSVWQVTERRQVPEDACHYCGSKQELAVCNNDQIICEECRQELDPYGEDLQDYIVMCRIIPGGEGNE